VIRDPIAACAALAGHRGRVLLHSGRNDDGRGRWSFVACDPIETLAVPADGFDALEAFAARHGADLRDLGPAGDPEPRVIGWIGYRGELWMGAYGAVARWPAGGEGEIVGPDAAARDRLAALLRAPKPPGPAPVIGELRGGDGHRERVERVLEYIRAGDVYQVNLARALVAPIHTDGDALALYQALDEVAAAPYAGLLETDAVRVVSGSPECFLSRAAGDRRIATRPIKGTRPRTGDPAGDRAAALALEADPKDAAEHVMIVDLERNDLGRVAVTGSVRVDRFGYLVELPHLYHKVSTVSAELRPGTGLAELLRATFPGGSITGAPKIRAMQIIDELEPARRGPYCGALGYLGAGGALELAISIRIAVLAGDELRIHVGGGIVADSDPAAELAETEDKAAGWRRALASLAT
jgi:para-aminobenzoate synthetase component 1